MQNIEERWLEPSKLSNNLLGPDQISSWRTQGYALVDGLIPSALIAQAEDDALAFFPKPQTPEAKHFETFGSGQKFVFPSRSSAVNELTMCSELLAAVSALLGEAVGDIRLSQSDLWPKYGDGPVADRNDWTEQRIHCDYPNHTLLHPPQWDSPEAVEVIIYLSDSEECGGATAVVPRGGPDDPAYAWPIFNMPGVQDRPYINSRVEAEGYLEKAHPDIAAFRATNLYARERAAHFRRGSVLFYRHDTWHRGRPVNDGACRIVQNLTFKKADSEWLNVLHPGWCWSMYSKHQIMERWVAQASIEQRALLGFPMPGHNYWSAETVAAVEGRYAAFGIDMSPYRNALDG
jgi:hypothetical protein